MLNESYNIDYIKSTSQLVKIMNFNTVYITDVKKTIISNSLVVIYNPLQNLLNLY